MTQASPHRILLVDSQPYQHREQVLKAGNFLVTRVPSLAAARSAYTPQHYDLVLVVTESLDGDPVSFCEELKQQDQSQTVALLSGPHVYFPHGSCPDDIIENTDGPRHLIRRISELIEPEPHFAD